MVRGRDCSNDREVTAVVQARQDERDERERERYPLAASCHRRGEQQHGNAHEDEWDHEAPAFRPHPLSSKDCA
jgi:hypothetical protein